MTKSFKNAAAFKTSLEARLRMRASTDALPLQTLQIKFVMERLLARLFHAADVPWLLKGGFAMDLRYRPRARTTRDIDLSVALSTEGAIGDLRDRLQMAAEIDLGDFFTFRIGELKSELTNSPRGGGRFPVEAVLVGKTYAKFSVDVGIGDTLVGDPEILYGDDLLEFAGIAPAVVRAIPKAQQFAEKIHAYTFPWSGRLNTRTKDLVDLVLMIERGSLEPAQIQVALTATFNVRNTHTVPETLTPPPAHWRMDFPGLATDAGLSTVELNEAFGIIHDFWNAHNLGKP